MGKRKNRKKTNKISNKGIENSAAVTEREKRENGQRGMTVQGSAAEPESTSADKVQRSAAEPESTSADKVQEAAPENAEEAEMPQNAETLQNGEKKQSAYRKWLKYAAGTAALILLGIYISGIVYFREKFLANTSINGIDVSFCPVEEAETRIRTEIEDYEIVLKERNRKEERISGEEIGYRYVSNGEIEALMKDQGRAFWFLSYFHPISHWFEAATDFDRELLKEKVRSLKCFDRSVSKAPVNAQMVFRGKKFVVQKEQQGCKVKKTKLLELLEKAVGYGEQMVDLEKEECYAVPVITSDNEALNKLVEDMNHYADIEITYCFGEQKEVLDGSIIKDWLTYDKDGKVLVKDGVIRDYIASLAEKYDTYDKPRKFRTSDGTYVTVEGGSYGWKIDQEAEALKLTELMEQEPHIERIPEFAQTAESWENGDMGDTYVEVDLTKQHLWMYIDGNLIVESDFVSGKMNRQRMTPPGTYRLYYKKSPAVLRSNRPGDSYESPVTFWMPFNGGIGFHDSSWRGSYGGEIYWNSGSHGCINLPYKAAETIYKNIEKGFPVICFYRNGENSRI